MVREWFELYGIMGKWREGEPAPDSLKTLLRELYNGTGKGVVVLVDEYDAPLTSSLSDRDLFMAIRNRLRNFYATLKDNQKYIRMLFVTGVTKFAHVSLFSGFNNLTDISLDKDFATICGYTEEELVNYFRDYLPKDRKEFEETLQLIRDWYNGYDFYGYDETSGMSYEEHRQKMCVYNPYDVLLYLTHKRLRSYWFETATPTFLVDYAKMTNREIRTSRLENIEIRGDRLSFSDLDNLDPAVLMFQTGYLTLDRIRESPFGGVHYTLRLPNQDVRIALSNFLLERYFNVGGIYTESLSLRVWEELHKGNVEAFLKYVSSLYEGLPYETAAKIRDFEGYHRDIFYTIL